MTENKEFGTDIEDMKIEKSIEKNKYKMTEKRIESLKKAREKRKQNLLNKKKENVEIKPEKKLEEESDSESSVEYVITKKKKKIIRNIKNPENEKTYEINFNNCIV